MALFGILGILIAYAGNYSTKTLFYSGAALGSFGGFFYRKKFEPKTYEIKKEIAAAVVPIIISPLFVALLGFINYFRGD